MQISEITAFLEDAYDILNVHLFGGELPRAVITIQSSPKAYGYITTTEIWHDTDKGYREINIGAEYLDRPIENVIATLVHEQTHFWNALHGIVDVSRSGTYHNRKFKETAEAHGLIIEYSPKIGYSVTTPSDSLVAFIEEQGWTGISLARNGGLGASGGAAGKKKSSTRKYICPVCGTSVRATKFVNIGCLDCQTVMELEEK